MNPQTTKWEAKFRNAQDNSEVTFNCTSEAGNSLAGIITIYEKLKSLVCTPDEWKEVSIRQIGRSETQAQPQAQPESKPTTTAKKRGFMQRLGEALTTD